MKTIDPDVAPYKSLVAYFDARVLAAYRAEPDRYRIENDFSHGRLQLTLKHYRELEADGRLDEFVDIEFGYRTLLSGELAIAAILPDLLEKSKSHVFKWKGFLLPNPQWSTGHDERFSLWARRSLGGDWSVGPGVRVRLAKAIHTINCLADEAVGKPLFTHELSAALSFPAAENSHRYQDAHEELYGFLIDGLDRDCISLLAVHLGKPVKVGGKWTVIDLKKVFPNLDAPSNFASAYDLVSNQRGLAAHKVRPDAEKMSAFEQFTKDLELCATGLNELLTTLEKELAMDGKKATERNEAKKSLPQIAQAAESHYSICEALRMEGKTVERVEFGSGKKFEEAHQSEVLIIHFTDGSIMSIDTHSNCGNLADELPGLKAGDFDVNFSLHWVPEK